MGILEENLSNNYLDEQHEDLKLATLHNIRQIKGRVGQQETGLDAPADDFYLSNLAQQVPAGVYTALNETIRGAEDLAGWMDDNLFGDLVSTDRIFDLPDTDEIFAEPQGTLPALTRGASQFLIAFLPGLQVTRALTSGRRLMQLARLSRTGKIGARFAQATIAGMAADFSIWNPHMPRMSNMINQHVPSLANPITEYLAADPEDSAIEGRLKSAIEGAGMGAVMEGLMLGLRFARGANKTNKMILENADEATLRDIQNEMELLGELDRGSLREKGVIGGKVARQFGKKQAKLPKDAVKAETIDEGTIYRSEKTGRSYLKKKGEKGFRSFKEEGATPSTAKEALGKAPPDVPISGKTMAPSAIKGIAKVVRSTSKKAGTTVEGRKVVVAWDKIRPGDAGVPDGFKIIDTYQSVVSPEWIKKQTIASMKVAIADLGLKVDEVLTPGIESVNLPDQIHSLARLVGAVQQATDDYMLQVLKPLAADAAAGGSRALAKFPKAFSEAVAFSQYAKAQRSDLGRAFRYLRETDTGWIQALDDLGLATTGYTDVGMSTKKLAAITLDALESAGPGKTGRTLQELHRPDGWKVVIELFLNSILSGFKTLMSVNPIGNTIAIQVNTMDEYLGSLLHGAFRGKGGQRAIVVTSAAGKKIRMYEGLQKGRLYQTWLFSQEEFVNTLTRGGKKAALANDQYQQLIRQDGQLSALVSGTQDLFKLAWRGFNNEPKLRLGRPGTKAVFAGREPAITAANMQRIVSGWPLANRFISPEFTSAGKTWANTIDFIGKLIRVPGRVLVGTDEIFKSLNRGMAKHMAAFDRAVIEGHTGSGLEKRIAWLIDHPQEIPNFTKHADDVADFLTWTKRPEGITKSVVEWTSSHPGFKIIAPFINTPAQLMHFSIKHTFGPNLFMEEIYSNILKGGAKGDLARGQVMTSALVTGSVAYLALNGTITGTGPLNSDLKRTMRSQGWQPLSIKVGDTYYSFSRFDPWAMTLGLVADLVLINGKVPDKSFDQLAYGTAMAVAKNITSKTYLQGISNFFELLSDPRQSKRYIRQTVAAFVPFSSLSRQVETEIDPALREARSVIDQIMSNIPGLSSMLPPSRNLKGDIIVMPPGIGMGTVPLYISPESNDPVWAELIRNQIRVGLPSQAIFGHTPPEIPLEELRVSQGVRLEPFEYDEYVRLAGNELKIGGRGMWDSLERLIRSSHYARATDGPDGGKAGLVLRLIRRYRLAARDEMLRRNKSLRHRVAMKQQTRILAKTGRSSTSLLGF